MVFTIIKFKQIKLMVLKFLCVKVLVCIWPWNHRFYTVHVHKTYSPNIHNSLLNLVWKSTYLLICLYLIKILQKRKEILNLITFLWLIIDLPSLEFMSEQNGTILSMMKKPFLLFENGFTDRNMWQYYKIFNKQWDCVN